MTSLVSFRRLAVLLIFVFNLVFNYSNNAFSTEISEKAWGSLSSKDRKIINDVAILIDNKKLDQALLRAQDLKINNHNFYQALQNIVLWNKYRKEKAYDKINFSDISRFVIDNDYFPNIKYLQKKVEEVVIRKEVPKSSYDSYFAKIEPKNRSTKIYLLEDKISLLRSNSDDFDAEKFKMKEIQLLVADIWINSDFSDGEEIKFLEKYQNYLSEVDHVARINRLFWDKKFDSARNNIAFVNEDYQKLFTAIIKINQNPKYINNIVLSVPRKLRDHEQLLFQRANFYYNNDELSELTHLLLNLPRDIGHPLDWWKIRHIHGRELLKKKAYRQAYKIISNHNINPKNSEYSEAEWLTGWIALRFLKEPKIALKHFEEVNKSVSYPISTSRSTYWIGASYEAMNDKVKAMKWYKIASDYPTYFYGQIAMHKYHALEGLALENFSLPQIPEVSQDDIQLISNDISLKTAYLLALMNEKGDSFQIFKNIIENLSSKGVVTAVVKIAKEVNSDDTMHKLYRFSNRKNVFFIDKQYKIVKELRNERNSSLIHSIIKQESGFSQGAVSLVGALGFMQVMPETAAQVARQLKIPYSKSRLATDLQYNILIGSYYINSLLENFKGSQILAISSYNAGPNRTNIWIKEFYDPRDYSSVNNYKNNDLDKVIDWIELITYKETRNYIQRVMENVLVYNYLIAKPELNSKDNI